MKYKKNQKMSSWALLKTIARLLLLLPIILVLVLSWISVRDRASHYPIDTADVLIPVYEQHSINFVPTYDATKTIPFTASAIVDIDGDGVEEIFVGGGIDQQDAIFQFQGGKFVDITDQTGWQKTIPDDSYGAVSLDFDNDGDNDVLVTRQTGVYLYRNDGGAFVSEKLALELDLQTVPLSAAVADINRDGLFDLYISGYIAREFVEGETIFNQTYGGISGLFLNKGDNQFENITESAGMFYQHNTFQAVFIDVDNDKFEDLVVAHDTGQIRTWKNNGDLTFENKPNPSSDAFAYPMGIAVTDMGNDGRPDFFFSNVGSTVPEFMVRGDLRDDQLLLTDWLLFENQGDFSFNDTAEQSQLADYAFAWGAVFEDFNLDGRDDLAVSENYSGWPLHKVPLWRLNGRFLLQKPDGKFTAAGSEAGVRNRHYGITPLTADFNQDGYPDLVHINLLGPQQVFISKGGSQGYLKVQLPNTVSSIAATVTVTLDDETKLIQNFVVGEGLASDQSHQLIFGLGNESAKAINVDFIDGRTAKKEGSYRNEIVSFK